MAGLLEDERIKPNKWQLWGATLGDAGRGLMGQEPSQVAALQQGIAEQQKALQAQQQRQQLAAQADQLGLSPKEKLLFMVNPQAFGNLLRDQEQPYSLSEGQQRFGPGGQSIASAPKTMTFGDQIVSAGPGGVESLFTRPKTYQEMQTELRDRLSNDRDVERVGIARGTLGVAQGRLGLSQKEYEARLKGIGGFGTPGVGSILGPTLDADWEVQP